MLPFFLTQHTCFLTLPLRFRSRHQFIRRNLPKLNRPGRELPGCEVCRGVRFKSGYAMNLLRLFDSRLDQPSQIFANLVVESVMGWLNHPSKLGASSATISPIRGILPASGSSSLRFKRSAGRRSKSAVKRIWSNPAKTPSGPSSGNRQSTACRLLTGLAELRGNYYQKAIKPAKFWGFYPSCGFCVAHFSGHFVSNVYHHQFSTLRR